MSFKAANIVVGGSNTKVESPTLFPITDSLTLEPTKSSPDATTLKLTEKELELMLLTIKNGLFRGEYVETVYNLTLKLQKNLVDLKYKNNKL